MAKKVIDGRIYNTETADLVAAWEPMADTRNFNYICESLYRTKRGNWFLHGEGGAASRYSEGTRDGMRGWGSDISALTSDEAMEWLSNHDHVEAIEEWFADKVEEA